MQESKVTYEQVFSLLDDCVDEASDAAQSGNWEAAHKKADTLRHLSETLDAVHVVALVAGISRRDWILILVSVAALAKLLIERLRKRHPK